MTKSSLGLSNAVVVLAGTGLAMLLLASASLAVGRSVQRYRAKKRRDRLRPQLRSGLLERLYGDGDPGWNDWVETLGALERSVLEDLLDEYLRELEGRDVNTLVNLGRALGVEDRARRRLTEKGYYTRLEALTWLTLLRNPPDSDLLEQYCKGTPRERAAAARALTADDDTDRTATAVSLVLDDHTEPFSVFGIDTLYRLAQNDPATVFERAANDFERWDPALQAQVLLVARHVRTVSGEADLSWMVHLLESPVERTRIEAAQALGGYGWRRALRDQIDVDELVTDPSPRVRASVYRMLGEWGDARAMSALIDLAPEEGDERARVAAAESLHRNRSGITVTVPESLTDAYAWVEARAVFD